MTTNEYAFSSVRIRALEKEIVGREKLEMLLDAPGNEQAMRLLSEFGFSIPEEEQTDQAGSNHYEKVLSDKLKRAYAELEDILPEKQSLGFLKYRYDCHNIKSALKGASLGISYEDMLIDLGTVPAQDYPQMLEAHDFTKLPACMARGAAEAEAEFAASRNPQLVDVIVDKACFADIKALCSQVDSQLLRRAYAGKADLLNIEMVLRFIRMGRSDSGKALLKRALLPGGQMDEDFFMSAYDEGEEYLCDKMQHQSYYALGKEFANSDRSFASYEKICDNYLTRIFKEVRFIPFGPEVGVCYLEGMETAIRNIRIVMAGKGAELGTDQIRERIRESYV